MPFCTFVTVSSLLDGAAHKQLLLDNQFRYHLQVMHEDDNNLNTISLTQHLQNIDLDFVWLARQKYSWFIVKNWQVPDVQVMCVIPHDVCRVTTSQSLNTSKTFAILPDNSICFRTIWKAYGVSNSENLTFGLSGGNGTIGLFIKTMLRQLSCSWHSELMTSSKSLKRYPD